MIPTMILDVTADERGLLVQLGEQKAYRVLPTSDWTLVYKCVGAELTFEPGPDRHPARVILHQNSFGQIAERIA